MSYCPFALYHLKEFCVVTLPVGIWRPPQQRWSKSVCLRDGAVCVRVSWGPGRAVCLRVSWTPGRAVCLRVLRAGKCRSGGEMTRETEGGTKLGGGSPWVSARRALRRLNNALAYLLTPNVGEVSVGEAGWLWVWVCLSAPFLRQRISIS